MSDGILSGGAFYVATNLSLAITHNVGALAIAGQLGVPFSLLLAIFVFRERIRPDEGGLDHGY